MVKFIRLISLIAGVLQIVLFFKIRGMTNSIKELKAGHFSEGIPMYKYGGSASLLVYLQSGA